MRRISKYIAGAMAVCMIATNLTTPVVYAMEQTVDITSSTVTESDEVADISSGQKELDVPINSEAENSNSTEESVSSAVSVPEDTTEDITNSAGSDSSSAIDAVESDTVNSDSNDPVDSESESQNTDQIPAMDFEEYGKGIGTVPKQKNGTAQLCNNLHCPVFDDNLSRIAG